MSQAIGEGLWLDPNEPTVMLVGCPLYVLRRQDKQNAPTIEDDRGALWAWRIEGA